LAAGKHARIALVAETAADARDVMVEGESGDPRGASARISTALMSHPSVEVAGGSLAIGMGYATIPWRLTNAHSPANLSAHCTQKKLALPADRHEFQ